MTPSTAKVGRLENFTEVEIVPIKNTQQLFTNEIPSTDPPESFINWGYFFNKSKSPSNKTTISTLNKYNKFQMKIVSNVNLLKNIDELSISDETKTIMEQPFNIYIYKKHIPKEILTENLTFIQCKISKILPPNTTEEELTLIVNLVIIDNFQLTQNIFPSLNHSTCFINSYLHRLLRLENGMKVLIENEEVQHPTEEILIQGISASSSSSDVPLEHAFKLYVLEHSKHNSILLNSNCILKISDSWVCYVRFYTGKCKYLLLNGDVLRNVKISVQSNLIDVENLKELAAGIYVKSAVKSVRSFVGKENICENFNNKFVELLDFGAKSLELGLGLREDCRGGVQNILITGKFS